METKKIAFEKCDVCSTWKDLGHMRLVNDAPMCDQCAHGLEARYLSLVD